MNKYGLHGHLKASPGKGGQLANILLEAAQLVSTAKGCQIYFISRTEAEPDTVWITEVWDSPADHEASLQVPGVRELIGQAMPILAESPQRGQILNVLGGHGVA